jgi:ABC-type branched-subunit amino acid transport system substrate-binding protein
MVVLLVVSACGSGGDAGDAVVDEPTAAADVADDVDAEAPTEDGGDGEGPTGESEAEADGPAVAEPQGDPIRIGAVLGISGRFAFVGGPQQNALLMAEEEMNAEGGIDGRPVEFVIYDDEVDETKTVPLFNRLIGEDDVVAVIGPSITIPALAVAPLAERAQIPNMTLTSRAIWEEEGLEYVYHTTPREEIEVNSLLAFIAEELGAETIAVLYDDQPYGTGNLAYIEQFAPDFGLEVVGTEPVANDETNAVPQLENLRQTDPDALIVWVGDPAASSTARGLEQIGWDVPMVGSSAIAYDAAYALKAAIEAAGGDTSGPAIIEGLNSLTAFEGVTATFNFTAEDHNGLGLDPLFYIVQVVDGQFQVVADTSQLAG